MLNNRTARFALAFLLLACALASPVVAWKSCTACSCVVAPSISDNQTTYDLPNTLGGYGFGWFKAQLDVNANSGLHSACVITSSPSGGMNPNAGPMSYQQCPSPKSCIVWINANGVFGGEFPFKFTITKDDSACCSATSCPVRYGEVRLSSQYGQDGGNYPFPSPGSC